MAVRGTKFVLTLFAVLGTGCSQDSDGGEARPANNGGSWSLLLEGDWTLEPGEEKERVCVKKTLAEDLYVSSIRPIHPLGTHHSILTMGEGDCTAAVANGLVYAAAVGSEGLTLPPGVAMKLPAGQTLNLGLHIYNTGQEVLEGTSGMEIQTIDADDVEFESETVLAGPLVLNIPPHQESVIEHDCAVGAETTVYAIFPHMHQLGTHIKTTFFHDGQATYVRDEPFQFDEQRQVALDPAPKLYPGDTVKTECTFKNDTAKVVTLGESTETEMCFSVLFRYPAGEGTFCRTAVSNR